MRARRAHWISQIEIQIQTVAMIFIEIAPCLASLGRAIYDSMQITNEARQNLVHLKSNVRELSSTHYFVFFFSSLLFCFVYQFSQNRLNKHKIKLLKKDHCNFNLISMPIVWKCVCVSVCLKRAYHWICNKKTLIYAYNSLQSDFNLRKCSF